MRILIAATLTFAVAMPATAQVFFGPEFLGHGTAAVAQRMPEATPPEAGFGRAVLRYADQLIIGVADHDTDARGAVVFHRREAGTWVEFQRIALPGDHASDQFGYALAMAGDRLAIGAPTMPGADGAQAAGAVHLYAFDAALDAWMPVDTITEPTPGALAHFGNALAFVDGTLFVAAPYAAPTSLRLWDPSEAGALGGRVYAYRHDTATDAWLLVQTLAGDNDVQFSRFGAALAADKDRLVVGAAGESAVYVYALDTGDATFVQRFPGPQLGGSTEGEFGRSLSLAGDRLLVAARGGFYYSIAADGGPAGRAYVLDVVDGAFEHTATLEGVDSQFGWTVLLLDAQQALVAAPLNGGSVLHFVEDADGWRTAQLLAEPVTAFDSRYFGEVLALTAGELYIGAPSASGDASRSGNVFEVPLVLPPFAALALALPGPAYVPPGETATFEFTVTSGAASGVGAAYLDVRTAMHVVTAPAGCFELGTQLIRCELGGIPAGGSHTVPLAIRVPTDDESIHTSINAYAGSELAEAVTRDNRLYHQVDRFAPAPPPDEGGGGSSPGLISLLLLALWRGRKCAC